MLDFSKNYKYTFFTLLAVMFSVYWFSSESEKPVEIKQAAMHRELLDDKLTPPEKSQIVESSVALDTISDHDTFEYLEHYVEQYPLPSSLEGTDIDGEISFDKNDDLQKTLQLRQIFDQLLTLENEWDVPTVRIWLTGYAQTATQFMNDPDDATEQVLASFDIYVDYLKNADSLIPMTGYTDSDFLAKFENVSSTMHELRVQSFGEETASSYFQAEEQYDQSQYDRAAIYADTSLTTQEREDKLATWRENIKDPNQRRTVLEQDKYKTLTASVAAMRQNSASDLEIYEARESVYGEQAAQRLAVLDQQQTLWDSRVDHYMRHYEYLAGQQLSENEIQQLLQSYVAEHFSEHEQRRLATLVR